MVLLGQEGVPAGLPGAVKPAWQDGIGTIQDGGEFYVPTTVHQVDRLERDRGRFLRKNIDRPSKGAAVFKIGRR